MAGNSCVGGQGGGKGGHQGGRAGRFIGRGAVSFTTRLAGVARPESGCCVQLRPAPSSSVQWEAASSLRWGLLSRARSPPATALVVPCQCRCKFKTQSGPSLCPTSHRAPLLSFSPNTHTLTHSRTRTPTAYSSLSEALLPNPTTTTLFHTVPPADLPLFSPLLNSIPPFFLLLARA